MNLHFAWWFRGAAYRGLLRASIASVRCYAPLSRLIVVGDDPGDSGVRHIEIEDGWPPMAENIEAIRRALYVIGAGDGLLMLDADTLLNGPVAELVHELLESDVIATWRDHVGSGADGQQIEGVAAMMPYNFGVFGIRRCLVADELLLWMRERVMRMMKPRRDWYGNQLCLTELFGRIVPSGGGAERRQVRIPWGPGRPGGVLRASLLPCERWNYTPQRADEDLSDRMILHFKGARRSLMGDYALRMSLPWQGG
jgi:hypothetical protein